MPAPRASRKPCRIARSPANLHHDDPESNLRPSNVMREGYSGKGSRDFRSSFRPFRKTPGMPARRRRFPRASCGRPWGVLHRWPAHRRSAGPSKGGSFEGVSGAEFLGCFASFAPLRSATIVRRYERISRERRPTPSNPASGLPGPGDQGRGRDPSRFFGPGYEHLAPRGPRDRSG